MNEYLQRVLEVCKPLADMYMIDYFVEDHWRQLPLSWQAFYASELALIGRNRRAMVDMVKSVLRRQGEAPRRQWTSPEPLLMLALRTVKENVELGSWKPVDSPEDVCRVLGVQEEGSEGFMELKNVLASSLRLKMKEKKTHEIGRIVDVVKLLLRKVEDVDEIVDLGAGLGHLSRALALLVPDRRVSTVEGDASLVATAEAIDAKIAKAPAAVLTPFAAPSREAVFVCAKEQIQPSGSNDGKLLITGLHTCGDFSATILRHFVSNKNTVALLHFGCCYHKLNGGLDKLYRDEYPETEVDKTPAVPEPGFPMSEKFDGCSLTYAARELACFGQEQFLDKLDLSIDKKSFFVNCYRAILEWILLDCPRPNSPALDPQQRHNGLRGFRGAENMGFWEYADEAMRDKPDVMDRFRLILTKHPNLVSDVDAMIDSHSSRILLLYAFRLLIAPVIEAVLLRDRQAYLVEQGVENVFLFPLFDPRLSPRNVALVAYKDNR